MEKYAVNDWISYNGGNVVNALLMGYFASKVFGRKTGRLLYSIVTILIMGVALPMLSTRFLPSAISLVVAFASFIAYYILMFKGSIKSKLIAFIVAYTILTVVSMLTFYIVGLMSIEISVVNSLINLLLLGCICTSTFYIVSKIWDSLELVRSNPRSMMFLFLPISQFAMAFLIMYILSHNPVSGLDLTKELLVNRVFGAAFVVVMTASLIADAAFLNGFRLTAMDIKERERLIRLQNENELTLNYIQSMKSDVDEMHRYRHDMLNIMTALKLALGEDSENGRSTAVRLIDELTDKISGLKAAQYSKCVIVNCVLSFEEELMRREGIKCELRADVPNEPCVNELDLCRIMINILDNARESCCRIAEAEERLIRFNMRVDDGVLYIACANSKPDGGIPSETSKSDEKNHGYGVKILRELTENNGGAFVLEEEDGMAKVIAMMKTER